MRKSSRHPNLMDELALNGAGFRATATRLFLVDLIRRYPRSTAAELIPYWSRRGLDRSVLYRNISVLDKAELITQVLVGNKVNLVPRTNPDRNTGTIQCLRCHNHWPFRSQKVRKVVVATLKAQHWERANFQLQVRGICPSCRLSNLRLETRL